MRHRTSPRVEQISFAALDEFFCIGNAKSMQCLKNMQIYTKYVQLDLSDCIWRLCCDQVSFLKVGFSTCKNGGKE